MCRFAQVAIQGTDYKAKLQEHVGVGNLPANYSGTRPPLSKATHPYEEAITMLAPADPTVAAVAAELLVMKVGGDAPPVSVFSGLTAAASDPADQDDNEPAAVYASDPDMPAEFNCISPEEAEALQAEIDAAEAAAAVAAAATTASTAAPTTGGMKQREFIY